MKRLCTKGCFRFTKVRQMSYESVSIFYYRYLLECNAWFDACNTFTESEIVVEENEHEEIVELNLRIMVINSRILLNEKRKK